ncbi:MAG: hypothetical protein ACKVT2_12700 [Saprospiraceae bacterium]
MLRCFCKYPDFNLPGKQQIRTFESQNESNSKIKVEARYQYSLSNLSTNDNVDASISPLFFNVGYLHRL